MGVAQTDRTTRTLQVLLLAVFVSSIFHYTDNFVRLDQYPQGDPPLVDRPTIVVSWVAFTAFGVVGYLCYLRGLGRRAAACFAVYSVSALISPLHYTYGELSDFDAAQHLFINTDLVAGLALLGFAVWLWFSPVASIRTES